MVCIFYAFMSCHRRRENTHANRSNDDWNADKMKHVQTTIFAYSDCRLCDWGTEKIEQMSSCLQFVHFDEVTPYIQFTQMLSCLQKEKTKPTIFHVYWKSLFYRYFFSKKKRNLEWETIQMKFRMTEDRQIHFVRWNFVRSPYSAFSITTSRLKFSIGSWPIKR